jgi:2-polyprenyl-3-methyl-5-hydroxy-6-metoxy-1,4-benzoquinol methylase
MIEKARSFIESAFPGGLRVYRRVKALNQRTLKETFSRIYESNSWADPESVSGRGSTLARTVKIRNALPGLLDSIGAKSLLDAACGDFNWLRHVDLNGIEYTGADVVPDLIAQNQLRYGRSTTRFEVLDITCDRLPQVDVILCRDCLIHLSFKHIHAAIVNFKRSDAAFVLATTNTNVKRNDDIQTGGWRSMNLELPPFNFPSPIQLVIEDPELGKCLGLWKLDDIS